MDFVRPYQACLSAIGFTVVKVVIRDTGPVGPKRNTLLGTYFPYYFLLGTISSIRILEFHDDPSGDVLSVLISTCNDIIASSF